jgi:hypothetical protein
MQNGKELWISRIYFPIENPVDRVHGVWIGRHGSGPWWTEAVRTRGHSGALLACGAWVLGLTSARWRQRRRMSWTRRRRRGAHRSMSGSREVA